MMNGPYPTISGPGESRYPASQQGGRPLPLNSTGYMAEVPFAGPASSGYHGVGPPPTHSATRRREFFPPPAYSSSTNNGGVGPGPVTSPHPRELAAIPRASHGFLGGIRDRLRQASRANYQQSPFRSRHSGHHSQSHSDGHGRGHRFRHRRHGHSEETSQPVDKDEGTPVVGDTKWGPEVQGALAFMRKMEAEETPKPAPKGKAKSKPPPPPSTLPPPRAGKPSLRHKESFVPHPVNGGSGSGGSGNTHNNGGYHCRGVPPQQPTDRIPPRTSSTKGQQFAGEQGVRALSPPPPSPPPSPTNYVYASGNGSAATMASSFAETAWSRSTVGYRSVGTQTDISCPGPELAPPAPESTPPAPTYKLSIWPKSGGVHMGLDGGYDSISSNSSSSHNSPPPLMLPVGSTSTTTNNTHDSSPTTTPSPPPKQPGFLARTIARLTRKINHRSNAFATLSGRAPTPSDAYSSVSSFEDEQQETGDQSRDQDDQEVERVSLDSAENSEQEEEAARGPANDVVAENNEQGEEAADRPASDVAAESPANQDATEAPPHQDPEVYENEILPLRLTKPGSPPAEALPHQQPEVYENEILPLRPTKPTSRLAEAFAAVAAACAEAALSDDDDDSFGATDFAFASAKGNAGSDDAADGRVNSASDTTSDTTAAPATCDSTTTVQGEEADEDEEGDYTIAPLNVPVRGDADGEAGEEDNSGSGASDSNRDEYDGRPVSPAKKAAMMRCLETITEEAAEE